MILSIVGQFYIKFSSKVLVVQNLKFCEDHIDEEVTMIFLGRVINVHSYIYHDTKIVRMSDKKVKANPNLN